MTDSNDNYYLALLTARGAVAELEAKVFAQEQALEVLRASVASYQRDIANPPAWLQDAVIKSLGQRVLDDHMKALRAQLKLGEVPAGKIEEPTDALAGYVKVTCAYCDSVSFAERVSVRLKPCLSDFREGQTWVAVLDEMALTATPNQKQAIGVVHQILEQIRCARTLTKDETEALVAEVVLEETGFDGQGTQEMNCEDLNRVLTALMRRLNHE